MMACVECETLNLSTKKMSRIILKKQKPFRSKFFVEQTFRQLPELISLPFLPCLTLTNLGNKPESD